MIAHLRGTLAARSNGAVVIDVGGIGYLVHVPTGVLARLPARGEEVVLHTSLQVREDAMTLYGFDTADARDMYELLLTAAGVGPRLALAALSTHAPDALRVAIAGGDLEALTLVPGVGRKLAQRLVLELKDRVGASSLAEPAATASSAGAEVRLALLELGYTPGEAQRALVDLATDGDPSEVLRAALRVLATVHAP